MPVTLTRTSPSTRKLQGAIGTLSTELRALSGSVDLTETVESSVNMAAPGAYARLVELHKASIDAFRDKANRLEAAVIATASADSDVDGYLTAHNP